MAGGPGCIATAYPETGALPVSSLYGMQGIAEFDQWAAPPTQKRLINCHYH